MKKTSKNASRNPGARSFADFVSWCVEAKGACSEADALAYVCETYKREYVLRYAAADSARLSARDGTCPEENVGVQFLNGSAITEQESESLYSRGVRRIFNDLRCTCSGRSKSVAFCKSTKTFTRRGARDCDVSTH
jgi:hypothetical protein